MDSLHSVLEKSSEVGFGANSDILISNPGMLGSGALAPKPTSTTSRMEKVRGCSPVCLGLDRHTGLAYPANAEAICARAQILILHLGEGVSTMHTTHPSYVLPV